MSMAILGMARAGSSSMPATMAATQTTGTAEKSSLRHHMPAQNTLLQSAVRQNLKDEV
jgi:hypothetical protein